MFKQWFAFEQKINKYLYIVLTEILTAFQKRYQFQCESPTLQIESDITLPV